MNTGDTVDSDVLVWERTNRTRGEEGGGNNGKEGREIRTGKEDERSRKGKGKEKEEEMR